MKKLYLTLAMMLVIAISNAQMSVIFEENWNNSSLESNFPPTGWTLVDQDGDGQNWYWGSYQGDGYILSRSYYNNAALTPNNWIISPPIELPAINTGDNLKLFYTVCPTANTPQYRTEHYGIYVSISGTNLTSFYEIFSETLTATMVNWVWNERIRSLNIYAGRTIHIAIRHYNSSDKDRIAFSDFKVYKETTVSIDEPSFKTTIYPNPAIDRIHFAVDKPSKVEIFNVVGDLVKSIENSTGVEEINDLNNGVYFVKIHCGDKPHVQKIIVNK